MVSHPISAIGRREDAVYILIMGLADPRNTPIALLELFSTDMRRRCILHT
jgi:hypothetical protein